MFAKATKGISYGEVLEESFEEKQIQRPDNNLELSLWKETFF